jgi:murein DD-endopeptidase MepM/ murein hydrolase activator NlpD
MKKINLNKFTKEIFISIGILLIGITVFFFSKPALINNNDTVIHEELNKELNNIYSFFVNKNSKEQNKKIVKVKGGESLQKILLNEGIAQSEINKIYSKITKKIDLKKIQQGQDITIILEKNNNQIKISRISFQTNQLSTAYILANENDYDFKIVKKNLEKVNFLAKGTIQNSLYSSAKKIGIDADIIIEFARIFGFEIDFQRDIRANDEFKIFYERYEDDDGEAQKNGNIIFAYMKNNGKEITLYRYKDEKNIVGYYTPDGKSIEKALMKTPINGARLSSVFGFRKHPILGYNKLHQGTDFAAPRGTPVMASGSGTIERASWYGAYGKYVSIRHNSTYKTAYAHLSAFGKNIRAGSRVQQGQIIGYVGSTGRSTGPHLHYEVLVNNKRVNSQRLNLPSGRSLTKKELDDFKKEIKIIDELAKKSKTNN